MLSCRICETFKNIYFVEHLQTAAGSYKHSIRTCFEIKDVDSTEFFRKMKLPFPHLKKGLLKDQKYPLRIVFEFFKNCQEYINSRSSHPDVFCKKGVLRNFAKFTGKSLCQSLCFNKVAENCSFIKIKTLAQVFSCEFCEISKNTFSYITPRLAVSEIRNEILKGVVRKSSL